MSDANYNELIVSDSCEDLIERVASEKRPADDDWTNRLINDRNSHLYLEYQLVY